MKAVFRILQTPYDLESNPNLNVRLQSEKKSYDLPYDENGGVYWGEVPEGKYKLIVNDIWINGKPYYYLFGEVKQMKNKI